MDEKALLAAVFDLSKDEPASALSLGEAHWHEMESRAPTPEDAESCRLLAFSAVRLEEHPDGALWRSRARRIATAIPWPELIAVLDMSEAFIQMAVINEDYPLGRTLDVIKGFPGSIEILQRLHAVADGPESGIVVTPRSPTTALIRRFVLEKTGSFQLAAGQTDAAATSFAAALEHAEGARGALKARGGLALADYLRSLDADDLGSALAAARETRTVLEELVALGEDEDTISVARHNAEVMERRGRDLLLYEVL